MLRHAWIVAAGPDGPSAETAMEYIRSVPDFVDWHTASLSLAHYSSCYDPRAAQGNYSLIIVQQQQKKH